MARYVDAIRWIAENDDTDWLYNENGCISVTASLVADMWNKTDEQVTKDLLKIEKKLNDKS